MKIVRAKFEGEIFYGELTDEGIIRYEGSPLVVWEPTEEKYSIDEIPQIINIIIGESDYNKIEMICQRHVIAISKAHI